MADPNNIPQEADQLKEDMNSANEDSRDRAKADVASPDFDKEYKIAQQNENGSGTQSSDPNPVNRKGADAGGDQSNTGRVDSINSPGDSDPDDYIDMAKDLTKKADAAAK